MVSAYIDTLPALTKEGGPNGIGTLRFAQGESTWSRRGGSWDGMAVGNVPCFIDVEDVDARVPAGVRPTRKIADGQTNLLNSRPQG